MVRLEEYNNLSRKQEDLLYKGYSFNTAFLTSFTLTSKDMILKARASESYTALPASSLAITGSASLQYTYDNIVFRPKKRSDGTSIFTLQYTPKEILQDFKLQCELKSIPKSTAQKAELTGKVEYKNPTAIAKLSFEDSLGTLNGSVTVGKPEFGTGMVGKFDLQQLNLINYTFAFWWFQKHRKLVAKQIYTGKNLVAVFDEVECSYYEKLNSSTYLGGLVRYVLKSQNAFIEFGGKYKMNENTSVKGKLDSNGLISLAYIHALTPQINLTTSTQVDIRKLNYHAIYGYKFGFRLDFNH